MCGPPIQLLISISLFKSLALKRAKTCREIGATLKKREVWLILEKVSHDKFFCQGSIQTFMNFKRVIFLSSFSSRNYSCTIFEVKNKSYKPCLTQKLIFWSWFLSSSWSHLGKMLLNSFLKPAAQWLSIDSKWLKRVTANQRLRLNWDPRWPKEQQPIRKL